MGPEPGVDAGDVEGMLASRKETDELAIAEFAKTNRAIGGGSLAGYVRLHWYGVDG